MDLKKSSYHNPEVIPVQRLLNSVRESGIMKYRNKWAHIDTDGYFGEKTEAAVIKFQSLAGLEQSGRVDQRTYNALCNSFPVMYEAPKQTMLDQIKNQLRLQWEQFYRSFRSCYEQYLGNYIQPILEELTSVSPEKMKYFSHNKLAKTQYFKDLAKQATQTARQKAIANSPEIRQIRNDIDKLEKKLPNQNAHNQNITKNKISQKTAKIDKVIREIKASNVVHPQDVASKVTSRMSSIGRMGGKAIKWLPIVLDTCEIIKYVISPNDNSDKDLGTLIGKLVDDLILIAIGALVAMGLAALFGASLPVWVAIIVSIAIGLVINSIYETVCEKIGGSSDEPLSKSLYNSLSTNLLQWIESPSCQNIYLC